MTFATYSASQPPLRERLAYHLRVLRVIASVEFKMKYVDSALGYVWTLAKPLAYFGVLWLVFHANFSSGTRNFPLYLLIGIALFTFLIDGIGTMLPSIVTRSSLLRRIAFPPLVIPISASLTSAMTFGVNLIAVAVFIVFSDVTPGLDWLLVAPLLLELYVFILGVGLLIATLFVRFRDIGPLWDLVSRLLLFATPIMYPITILPQWVQKASMLNPFVQVLEDVRKLILGNPSSVTALFGMGAAWRLLPIIIALGTFGVAVWLYRREAPRFAELA